jgi:hypothetical protein
MAKCIFLKLHPKLTSLLQSKTQYKLFVHIEIKNSFHNLQVGSRKKEFMCNELFAIECSIVPLITFEAI